MKITKMKKPALWVSAALLGWLVSPAAEAQHKMSYEQYIEKYKHLAVNNMNRYSVPASITMAQALLESGCGSSKLAVEANNHFGIKCRTNWEGDYILHDDDDAGECFRKYERVEDSYNDHSEFLRTSARYSDLFQLDVTDYEGWAKGLQQAGYATNTQYAALLVQLIDRYELHRLDGERPVAQNTGGPQLIEIRNQPVQQVTEYPGMVAFSSPRIDPTQYLAVSAKGSQNRLVFKNNGASFIITEAGDTFESLSRELKINKKSLHTFNDIRADQSLLPNQMVYISKKKKKAGNGFNTYTVERGDNLYLISQKFGISLEGLRKVNGMPYDYEVQTGQVIRLR